MDTLVPGTRATIDTLRARLDRAAAAATSHDTDRPRDQYPPIDTFLASTSRHLGAVTSVVVPAVRTHLDDGAARAREFVEQCRRLEMALNQVKAKLYGSSYAVRRSWGSIWDDVREEFDETTRLETALVADIATHLHEQDPDWGEELYHAELRAPTRPHPFIPHQGARGKVARAVALRVDRFWDTAEGRMVPEPVRHHERSADGRLTQYLLADPHLPEDEGPDRA
ncbi:MAG TPA: hypothetical protein VF728_01840 [Nocardioides sp.]